MLLIIALVILVGGGLYFWKKRASSGGGPPIPPISSANYDLPSTSANSRPWIPERQLSQMPTGYAQIGGYGEQVTQNPGITRTFAARKTGGSGSGCGKCGLH